MPHSPPHTPPPRHLTIEHLLWALIALVAALMRLGDLARWPLAQGESSQALAAWHGLAGASHAALGALSPLAYDAQLLLFATVGDSDLTARLAQALAGIALVLSPWLLRRLIGRGSALATSLLLLISPSVLFFSRNATGEMLGALCAMLLLAGLLRWERWGSARDGMLAALALGLGLASSGGFWSLLLALAIAGLIARRRSDGQTEYGTLLRRFGWIALAAFLLGATAFGTHLAGLGWAVSLPLGWVQQLAVGPSLAFPSFFTLLLYEFLPLILAIFGTSYLNERHARLATIALAWVALLIVPITLLNSGWAGGMLWMVLPLTLLGGAALAQLGARLWQAGEWRFEGLMAVGALLLLIFYRIILQLMIAGAGMTPTNGVLMLLLGTVLFVGVAGLLLLSVAGRPDALTRGLLLAGVLILAISSVGSAWGLSFVRGSDPREPLVVAPTDRDLRTAATTLARASIERYMDARALPVGVQESLGPAPLWYLRDFSQVTPVLAVSEALPEAALLAPEQAPPDRIAERVELDARWTTADLSQSTLSLPVLRWLLTREAQGVQAGTATLYLKPAPR